MDTNNSNASISTDDEEMEIPTQEATDALFEGFDKRHAQWEKNQARQEKYRSPRRKNKAKEVMQNSMFSYSGIQNTQLCCIVKDTNKERLSLF
jgi:hypothetical protein